MYIVLLRIYGIGYNITLFLMHGRIVTLLVHSEQII